MPTTQSQRDDTPSPSMPQEYDRIYGSLDGLPDVTRTKASTVIQTPPLGVGGSRTFFIQTARQREVGDTIFIQTVGPDGGQRIVLGPEVAAAIARQRDSLTTMVARKHGKRIAAERKAAGIAPAFLGKGARAKSKKGGR
ncbi:MAG: hypothetical protein V4597_08495 [Pseudomonadota bacterium]